MHSLTATEIATALRFGTHSAREITEAALNRITALNPRLNAITDRCDVEALATADALDHARAKGETLPPMAGVPVTIKCLTDQAGHATTNGTRINQHLIATTDSPVVSNLRRAGAIIIGRTNTPAFSLRWFTRNQAYGQTLNPLDPTLTPGGSSGGAAVAAATGMGAIAHGTDIAGSIRYPAYACGIHGLRPSLGRVPGFNASGPDRLIGAQLMAVSGPLARSVPDLALAFRAMSHPDPRDPWSLPETIPTPAPRRIALCPAPEGLQTHPAIRQALTIAAHRFQSAGYEIIETSPPPLREAVTLQLQLWMGDMRRTRGAAVYAEGDADAIFVYENLCRHAPPPSLDAFMDIFAARSRLIREWRAFFESTPLMLCPVSTDLPFANNRDVASDADFDAIIEAQTLQIAPPLMGLPGLTVSTGAPMAVQLLAAPYREDLLLEAGAVIGDAVPVVG